MQSLYIPSPLPEERDREREGEI
jgi:hypothetical protein